jgi:hypothetical protein
VKRLVGFGVPTPPFSAWKPDSACPSPRGRVVKVDPTVAIVGARSMTWPVVPVMPISYHLLRQYESSVDLGSRHLGADFDVDSGSVGGFVDFDRDL